MGAVLAWLSGSRVGRWTAAIVAACGAAGVFVLEIFRAGETAEKRKVDDEELQAGRTRQTVADAVTDAGAAAARKRLRGWGRG